MSSSAVPVDADRAVLLREMNLALLAELGARSIYADLIGLSRDEELRKVLARLLQEEQEQIADLARMMAELGGRPRTKSLRRRLLAGALARLSPLIGRRVVLRVCAQAEDKASRWYNHFQHHLLGLGEADHARTCSRLSLTKRRHAQALQTWVEHGLGR